MFNSLHHTLGTLLERMRLKSYEMKQIAGQERLCSILEKWLEILNIFMKVVPEENARNESNVDVKSQTTGKKSSLMKIIPARFTGLNPIAVLDGDLSSKIMDITNRLEELDRKRNALGLRVISVPASLPFFSFQPILVEARGAMAWEKECHGMKGRLSPKSLQRVPCHSQERGMRRLEEESLHPGIPESSVPQHCKSHATASRMNAAAFRKPCHVEGSKGLLSL
ncbi:hypothetical protein Pint_03626 [Pistacia integerrima]|uniref:Uncharacterized protein n=1 Tax=Pistacia integerrima TaxID=434235 RepID=A0ACC0Z659_9ROSI|nr:hypothetical protein Pint_03626 [Pistacia integerrima]